MRLSTTRVRNAELGNDMKMRVRVTGDHATAWRALACHFPTALPQRSLNAGAAP
jgi:hypothetical protein